MSFVTIFAFRSVYCGKRRFAKCHLNVTKKTHNAFDVSVTCVIKNIIPFKNLFPLPKLAVVIFSFYLCTN